MTIRAAITTARDLFLSTVTPDRTPRPSPAAITAARQKLDGESLGQWSPDWQRLIIVSRKMIADCA